MHMLKSTLNRLHPAVHDTNHDSANLHEEPRIKCHTDTKAETSHSIINKNIHMNTTVKPNRDTQRTDPNIIPEQ